ncbi:MAG TPA: glycosyltransferase family 39 protein [Gemmatimonadales bacterium]|nr:glycosyltransferase family 39 protein [Gemmatimonadales bacterium]
MADPALPVPLGARLAERGWPSALRAHWPLALILLAGGFLRWMSPGRIALWRDEAQYVAVANLPGFAAITSFLYHNESHPPLYYYLGHVAGRLFGDVEGPMGALSLAASVGAIIAAYLIASAAFSRVAGVIAALGVGLSVPLALYSVQLRPYALLALLLLVAQAALWRFWQRGERRWLAVWGLTTVAALYTHYLTVLVVAAQGIAALWLLARGVRPAGGGTRALLAGCGAIVALALPLLLLLPHQAATTSYPALRPLQLDGPPRLLLGIALGFPFELVLPLVLAAALAIGALGRRRWARELVLDPRLLLIAPFPLFLLLATAATYRSQFLTPHVLLGAAPLGPILFGAVVTALHRSGARWKAAIWFESGVALLALSALLAVGYSKTTMDAVARGIMAEASPSDLVFVSPGVAGTSFNRYFHGSNSQFNYPYAGRLVRYPFGRDVERVSSEAAFRMALDSIHSAWSAGRRVWLVGDIRWIRSDQPAPDALPAESFGGIGQADRARVNRFERYLRWLYGPPVRQVGAVQFGSGPEAFAGWLFAHSEGAGGAGASGR